jgi:short-subunit dehydrogenase
MSAPPAAAAPRDQSFARAYGPWALIAGASDGVGAEFGRQLAAKGISCVLVARRAAPLDALGAELRERHGVETRTVALDLSLANAGESLERATADLHVGLLAYVAGSDPHGARFLDVPLAEWLALTRRNVDTLMSCVHGFAGRMKQARRGGIIIVGSHAAFNGTDRLSTYSATKAFGLNLGESLWAELKPSGVDVLNLLLDATDTPTMRAALVRHGIAIESLPVALPADVVRAGLARLGDGPTLIWGGDEKTEHPFLSDQARRQRVMDISKRLSLFYGDP